MSEALILTESSLESGKYSWSVDIVDSRPALSTERPSQGGALAGQYTVELHRQPVKPRRKVGVRTLADGIVGQDGLTRREHEAAERAAALAENVENADSERGEPVITSGRVTSGLQYLPPKHHGGAFVNGAQCVERSWHSDFSVGGGSRISFDFDGHKFELHFISQAWAHLLVLRASGAAAAAKVVFCAGGDVAALSTPYLLVVDGVEVSTGLSCEEFYKKIGRWLLATGVLLLLAIGVSSVIKPDTCSVHLFCLYLDLWGVIWVGKLAVCLLALLVATGLWYLRLGFVYLRGAPAVRWHAPAIAPLRA